MANELSREISRRPQPQRPAHHRSGSRRFWRIVLALLLFVAFVWLGIRSVNMLLTYKEARDNRIFAESQKIKLENDINDLNKKIDQVKTGVGVEEHIRTKYPLVKEGERVLVISPDESGTVAPKKTFWQKIKNIFN